uniref:TonB_dep_Rec domain-containing protein n=1 Tax=Panagrellus redivivus TaxID=6233 RepID=A0A7E4USM5_PANRE
MLQINNSETFKVLLIVALVGCSYAQLRSRPRGLGLLQLPTGMVDERSGPFFPNLYIAGDKAGTRPQTVPDFHLPGQTAIFTGKTAFNPFTNAVSAVFTEDLVDSWGAGFAVNGVNNYNLKVRENFDEFADAPLGRNDGGHQPFLTGFTVGSEYDFSKIRQVSGHMDLPIPGVNELFDFDGSVWMKGNGNGIFNGFFDFPLTLSDPHERFPASFKYLNFMADRHMHYGHVVPNVNLFLLPKDKIMERLGRNRLNPTVLG